MKAPLENVLWLYIIFILLKLHIFIVNRVVGSTTNSMSIDYNNIFQDTALKRFDQNTRKCNKKKIIENKITL